MDHFVQIGNLYADKDKRNNGRVLKVIKMDSIYILCSIGYFNDRNEWYNVNHTTKIRIDRLYDKKLFKLIDSSIQTV